MKQTSVSGSAAAWLLLLFLLPFARHWLILNRPVEGVYYEQTAFVFYLSDAALLILLLTEAWSRTMRPQADLPPTSGRIHFLVLIPLLLLTLLAWLSVSWAQDKALALYLSVRLAGLFLLVLVLVRLRPRTNWLSGVLAFTLFFQAVIALLQFLLQNDLGWQAWGEVELGVPGLASVVRVGVDQYIRGYGLTPHPNILGGVLVALLLILVTQFLAAQGRGRVFWLIILGIGAVGLLVTFSRSAWLGGVVGGGFLLLWLLLTPTWRQKYGRLVGWPIALAVFVLIIFVAMRPELFLARLRPSTSYTESRSLDERAGLALLARELVITFPLTGVGVGGFTPAIANQAEQMTGVRPQPAHNIPLLVTTELGLLGGLFWLWLMVTPVLGMLIAWREHRLTLLGLGLTAALIALAVIDLFDFYSWGWAQGRLLRWSLWGLWLSEVAYDQPEV